MQERVKLTKRQIKEDKFTAFMLNSKHTFEENWQYISIGVVIVILAIAGVVYYMNSVKETEEAAAQQIAQADMQYRQGNSQVAILTLTDVLSKYAGSKAAEQATFLLGRVNLETRNYEEAKTYYNQYLDKYKKDNLNRAAAYSGLGVAYEDQGKYAEAAETFEKGAKEFAGAPLEGELHFGALRNYLMAGQPDKAKPHLDFIQDNFPGSEMATRSSRLYYEESGS